MKCGWILGASFHRGLDMNRVSLVVLRVRLVHCNNYYIGVEISITRNTLSWNVISITIH